MFLFCIHGLLAFKVPVLKIKSGLEIKSIFKTKFDIKEVEISLKNTLLSMTIISLLLAALPSSAFADEAKDVQVYWDARGAEIIIRGAIKKRLVFQTRVE
jgi:hypothetical protein